MLVPQTRPQVALSLFVQNCTSLSASKYSLNHLRTALGECKTLREYGQVTSLWWYRAAMHKYRRVSSCGAVGFPSPGSFTPSWIICWSTSNMTERYAHLTPRRERLNG